MWERHHRTLQICSDRGRCQGPVGKGWSPQYVLQGQPDAQMTLTLTSQTPQALLFTPTLLLFPISASLVPGVPTDRCLPWPAQCLLPADVLLCTGSRGKPFICPFPSTRWAPSEYQSAPGGRRGGRREVGPGRELVPGTKQMGFLYEDDQEPPGCLVKEAPRSGQSFQKDVLGMGVRDRPEAWVGCSARHPGRLLPAASPLGSVSSLCSSRSCPLPGCVEYVSMVVLPTFHVSALTLLCPVSPVVCVL